MQVKRCLFSVDFFSASSPAQVFQWATGGAIDRFTINVHPFSDLIEPLDRWRQKRSFAGGADVKQIVAALVRDVNQISNQGL